MAARHKGTGGTGANPQQGPSSKGPGAKVSRQSPGKPLVAGPAPLPTKDDILKFIQTATETVGKREIARAFNIKGDNRIALKKLLVEMADDGQLAGNRKSLQEKGRLPPMGTFEIVGRDPEGDLIAEPKVWNAEDGAKPKAVIRQSRKAGGDDRFSLGSGDLILGRTMRLTGDRYTYAVEPIKKLPKEKTRALGIYRAGAKNSGQNTGGMIEPIDKKEMRSWPIDADSTGGAKTGDLVRFDLMRSTPTGSPMSSRKWCSMKWQSCRPWPTTSAAISRGFRY
jgi:ribonuclease R